MSNCIGFSRHWFSFYRQPGLRSPVCVRACGTLNHRPLNDQEWAALLEYRELRGYPLSDHIEDAINAYKKAREYVIQWNKKHPPGYDMVSFTTWHRRVTGKRPDDLSTDYVKRHATNYRFKN